MTIILCAINDETGEVLNRDGSVAGKVGCDWMQITDKLPESGKPVLVACGKKVLRAAYAAKFSLAEDNWGFWNDGDGADYNEADDMTYWPEGWYEWNEHEECHWMLQDLPTHWMPLPVLAASKVDLSGCEVKVPELWVNHGSRLEDMTHNDVVKAVIDQMPKVKK